MNNTVLLVFLAIAGIALLCIFLHRLGQIRDLDNNYIPDAVDDKVKKVKEDVTRIKKEVKQRTKRVKQEMSEVIDAVKEVGNQAEDVIDAVKGKPRKASKPRAKKTDNK